MISRIVELTVGRAVKSAVDEFVGSERCTAILDGAIHRILAEPQYAWFRFVKAMQAEMLRVDPTLKPKRAFYIARDAYREYLKDEKIEFGDPACCWDESGARDVIHAYEIDYWEGRA